VTIAAAAVAVEGLINLVNSIKDVKETSWKYWGSLIVGLLAGVLISVNYNLDLFAVLGLEGQIPYVGPVLTGLVLSRGSNYASDILGRIQGKPAS
jgi:hypothetical protein